MRALSVVVFGTLCSVLLSSSLVTRVSAATTTSDDFAVAYQENYEHTGEAKAINLHLPLHVLWSVDLGQGVSYPIVADGRVFVVARNTIFALDARTGQTIWTQQTQADYGWVPGLAFENDMVFAVADPVFVGAAIFAFNDRTGRQIWAHSLGQYLLTSPPEARYGIVYTSGSGSGGTLYAIRSSNGRPLWNANVYYGDDSSPVVTKDGVYVSYACPQTSKFSPLSGVLLWQFSGPCSGGGGSTPVLYRNLLFVEDSFINSNNGVILNATDGTLVGFFDSLTTPAIAQDLAILNTGNALTALRTDTLNVQWQIAPPLGDSFGSAPLILSSLGAVVDATSNGVLVGYKLKTGHKLFSVSLGFQAGASAMAAGSNRLYVPAGTHLVAVGD